MQLLGAIGVFFLAGYLALRGGTVFHERLQQMEGLLLLLRHIRERISCFRTPKAEILASFRNPALSRAGFLSALRGGDLLAALDATADRLYLDEEEGAILSEFAAGLGTGFLSEELARCDLAIGRMEAAIARRREALPRTAKLYRTLVVSLALAVIIVFI